MRNITSIWGLLLPEMALEFPKNHPHVEIDVLNDLLIFLEFYCTCGSIEWQVYGPEPQEKTITE